MLILQSPPTLSTVYWKHWHLKIDFCILWFWGARKELNVFLTLQRHPFLAYVSWRLQEGTGFPPLETGLPQILSIFLRNLKSLEIVRLDLEEISFANGSTICDYLPETVRVQTLKLYNRALNSDTPRVWESFVPVG